jgi:DNA-binding NarL/FixJ family response regulator
MESNQISIAILDDHEISHIGLKSILEFESSWKIVFTSNNSTDFLKQTNTYHLDLVIIDYVLPDTNGLEISKIIKNKSDKIKTIIISSINDIKLINYLKLNGVDGFISKSEEPTKIRFAIKEVLSGNNFFSENMEFKQLHLNQFENTPFSALTKRELEVVRLTALGYSQKAIAKELGISVKTVQVHKINTTGKMGKISDPELTKLAFIYKLIEHDALISIK